MVTETSYVRVSKVRTQLARVSHWVDLIAKHQLILFYLNKYTFTFSTKKALTSNGFRCNLRLNMLFRRQNGLTSRPAVP